MPFGHNLCIRIPFTVATIPTLQMSQSRIDGVDQSHSEQHTATSKIIILTLYKTLNLESLFTHRCKFFLMWYNASFYTHISTNLILPLFLNSYL